MKLVLERSACGDARVCPNINSTDRNTYVVQGYIPEPPAQRGEAETSLEIPVTLLPELAAASGRDGLVFTGRGTVLVTGERVTDPQALAELSLPDGEDAVEVPFSLLAELQEAQPC